MKTIFNKFISILIVFVIPFSFSSCMKTVNDNYEDQLEISDVDYKAIYRYFLTQEYEKLSNANEVGGDKKFGLFYIDSNSVPELVIANGMHHGAVPELYTIVNNQVEYVGEFGSFGAFQFGEKSGLIMSNHFVNGGLDIYCVYSFENGATTYLWGGGEKSFPASDEEDERPSQYFIYETDPYDDDESDIKYQIDKETFESLLSFYESKIDTDLDGKEAMIEFTLQNIDFYIENFDSLSSDNNF